MNKYIKRRGKKWKELDCSCSHEIRCPSELTTRKRKDNDTNQLPPQIYVPYFFFLYGTPSKAKTADEKKKKKKGTLIKQYIKSTN